MLLDFVYFPLFSSTLSCELTLSLCELPSGPYMLWLPKLLPWNLSMISKHFWELLQTLEPFKGPQYFSEYYTYIYKYYI